jgi:hypothetical protein
MAGEHVAGLLNLGTLAAGLTLAYIGIDKFTPERLAIDRSQEASRQMMRKALEKRVIDAAELTKLAVQARILANISYEDYDVALRQLDAADDYTETDEDLILLHYVAGIAPPKHRWSLSLMARRFWYIPPCAYFEKRIDISLLSISAALSTFMFLSMSAATVWRIEFVDNTMTAAALFIVLTAILLAVIGHSVLLYRISVVPKSTLEMVSRRRDRLSTKGLSQDNRIGRKESGDG